MFFPEIFFLIIYLGISFIIGFLLQKRYSFFRELKGIFFVLLGFLVFTVLHNLFYSLTLIEESVFFLFALFSAGVFIFLIVFFLAKKLLKK